MAGDHSRRPISAGPYRHISAPIASSHHDQEPQMPSVSERPVKRSIRRTSCEKSFLWRTAPFTRWSSAENFHAALAFHPDASSGILPRSRRGSKARARGQSRAPNTPTSPSGSSGRSKGRVGLKHRHGRGEQGDWPLAAFHPRVNDVRPFLEHMAALNLVSALL